MRHKVIQGVLWHPFSILLLLQRFCSSLNGELLDCGIYIIVFCLFILFQSPSVLVTGRPAFCSKQKFAFVL